MDQGFKTNESTPRGDREKRRRRENREAILLAAEAVILRRGFTATSMDDVAAEADFSKATVYRYFRSKAELLFEIMIHFMDEVEERTAAIRLSSRRSAALRLRDTLAEMIGYLAEKENISRVVMADRTFLRLVPLFHFEADGAPAAKNPFRLFVERIKERRAVLLKGLEGLVAEGIAAGEFRPLDPAAVSAYASAVVTGVFHERFWSEEKLDLEKTVDMISDLLLRGLTARGDGRGEA